MNTETPKRPNVQTPRTAGFLSVASLRLCAFALNLSALFALFAFSGCATTPTPKVAMTGDVLVDGPNMAAEMTAEVLSRAVANGRRSVHDQQDGRVRGVHVVELALQRGESEPMLLGEAQKIGVGPLAMTAQGTE